MLPITTGKVLQLPHQIGYFPNLIVDIRPRDIATVTKEYKNFEIQVIRLSFNHFNQDFLNHFKPWFDAFVRQNSTLKKIKKEMM